MHARCAGDPTVFGNLPPCSVLTKAAEAAVRCVHEWCASSLSGKAQ